MTSTSVVVATAFGGPEVLSIVEQPLHAPGPGEVSVEIRAAGVNPADVKAYGSNKTDESVLPLRLGMEAAGVVVAVGPDAVGPTGDISVGDEVIAYRIAGGYATAVTVSASSIVDKPPSVGWDAAGGLMLAGATAAHLLTATRVEAGDTVLIHSASGAVGLIATQLAALRGATVIGTASEGNFDLLRKYGAFPIAYGDGLIDRIREVAPGGVDAALDTIGTDEAIGSSSELVADGTRSATVAGYGKSLPAGMQLLGNGPGADPGRDIRAAARLDLAQLAGEGMLDVRIGATFALAEVRAAHELSRSGHPGGKIILLP